MAPLNLSLLLLRVDYIVCDIGTVKNRILARHFLNGEKEGGITVKSTHIAKAVKPARYTTFFKTPAKGKRTLAVLLCVCLLAGCAAFSGCGGESTALQFRGEGSDYNVEFSLEEAYVPEQGALSFLPWFTSFEEAGEILHLEDMPEEDYKVWGDYPKHLSLYNVKLKEYRYPMELRLTFVNNPATAEKEGLLLCHYVLLFGEVNGVRVDGGEDFAKLPDQTQQEVRRGLAEDRNAWLATAAEKYRDVLAAAQPGREKNMFESMLEDENAVEHFSYRFPWQQEDEASQFRVSINSMMIQYQMTGEPAY